MTVGRYIIYGSISWLLANLEYKLQESSESEEDFHDTPKRRKPRLPHSKIEDIFKYSVDKQTDYQIDLTPIVDDFHLCFKMQYLFDNGQGKDTDRIFEADHAFQTTLASRETNIHLLLSSHH